MFSACMRDCYDTCSIISNFKNGRLTVRGNPEHPITRGFLCPKGALLPKWFHSKERLRKPLILEGKKGSGEFREASWKEALNLIAENINEAIREHGSYSVLVYKYAGDRGRELLLPHEALPLPKCIHDRWGNLR